MDKEQSIHSFWSGFGIPAYDENSVPDDAVMPYITYDVYTSNIDGVVPLHASIWYEDYSWENITKKSHEISKSIGFGHKSIPMDEGFLYLTLGSPFAQRMSDSDTVKRIYININAEFLTAY